MTPLQSVLTIPVSADEHAQGPASAPVTLVEYGDFQCPACGMAYPLVQQIQQHYGKNLRFVFRHFPLTQAHPFAKLAAEVSEIAAAADRFWPMHGWLYENQESWSATGPVGLEQGLRELSIDPPESAIAVRDIDARIQRDFMGGVRSGVNGTPSFFLNGRMHDGGIDALARAIGRAIA